MAEEKSHPLPGLPELIATADSEVLDVESPHFEGVTGAEVPADVHGGVGTASMEDVEVEEVEKKIPTSNSNRSDKVDPV